MGRLPYDFKGVRLSTEVRRDLLSIAHAGAPFDKARVVVDSDAGPVVEVRGRLSAHERSPTQLDLRVDGHPCFRFDADTCRGGWLETLDGDDYYDLLVDVGWGRIAISDNYN